MHHLGVFDDATVVTGLLERNRVAALAHLTVTLAKRVSIICGQLHFYLPELLAWPPLYLI